MLTKRPHPTPPHQSTQQHLTKVEYFGGVGWGGDVLWNFSKTSSYKKIPVAIFRRWVTPTVDDGDKFPKKNQKLISLLSESHRSEIVLLIFFGTFRFVFEIVVLICFRLKLVATPDLWRQRASTTFGYS